MRTFKELAALPRNPKVCVLCGHKLKPETRMYSPWSKHYYCRDTPWCMKRRAKKAAA